MGAISIEKLRANSPSKDDVFALDSGSACTAEDLQPSHVLAAMGVLTHGNIRITLLANDPATWPDLQAWARMTKNLVVQFKENVYEITKLS